MIAPFSEIGWVVRGADHPPNVILIMTDDQGYGDVGVHGNPKIKTPHMDQLAQEGARFQWFYTNPICTPTRASLLTGRDLYRTGMISGGFGQATIHTDEVTIAEPLRAAGYRTAVFGKWHLGDNYPSRPMDQGFEVSLKMSPAEDLEAWVQTTDGTFRQDARLVFVQRVED